MISLLLLATLANAPIVGPETVVVDTNRCMKSAKTERHALCSDRTVVYGRDGAGPCIVEIGHESEGRSIYTHCELKWLVDVIKAKDLRDPAICRKVAKPRKDFHKPQYPLVRAAADGDLEALRDLMLSGQSIDVEDDGMTPVVAAALYGQRKAYEVLVLSGPEAASKAVAERIWQERKAGKRPERNPGL